jgi:membrane protease YdiL (CAAX protease family)
MLLPAAVTGIYALGLHGHKAIWQSLVYSGGKTLQFAVPVLVWIRWSRRRGDGLGWPGLAPSLAAGVVFGVLVAAAMQWLYWHLLAPSGWMSGPEQRIAARLQRFGLASPLLFWMFGLFVCLVHSAMEEVYWRWFVFGALRRRCSPLAAGAVSSLGFALHHVIVLAIYFGFTSPLCWWFSAAVMAGGMVWSWIYHHTDNLWGSWCSHCIVDLSIFLIAFQMLQSSSATA